MEDIDKISGTFLPKGSPPLSSKRKSSSSMWQTEQENGHSEHNRPRVSEIAINLAQTISQLSIQKSVEAIHKVGSFMGVTEEDNHMEQWKEKFLKRIESKDIGFNVENILPEKDEDEMVIKQIEETISQVTAARQEQDSILEEMQDTNLDEYVISSNIIGDDSGDDLTVVTHDNEMKSQHSMTPSKVSQYTMKSDSIYNSLGLPSFVYKRSRCDFLEKALQEDERNSQSTARNVRYRKLNNENTSESNCQTDLPVDSAAMTSSIHKEDQVKPNVRILPVHGSQAVDWNVEHEYNKHCPKTSESGGHMTKEPTSGVVLSSTVSQKSVKSAKQPGINIRGQSFQQDGIHQTSSPEISEDTWNDNKGSYRDIDFSDGGYRQTSSVHFSPVVSSFSQKKSSSGDLIKSILKRRFINQNAETRGIDVELQRTTPSKSILKEQDFMSPTLKDYKERSLGEVQYGFGMKKSELFSLKEKHKKYVDSSKPAFLYRAEALKHYQEFLIKERMQKKMELAKEKERMEKRINLEKDLLKETVELSRAQFKQRQGRGDPGESVVSKCLKLVNNLKKFQLKRRIDKVPDGSMGRLVQKHLDELPEYKAWFIYITCLVQILTFICLLGMGGATSIGLEPELELRQRTLTFKGLETAEHWKIHNIWIGPSHIFMIGIGAMFAPCMRSDVGIRALYAKNMAIHNGFMTLGCCEVQSRSTAGTTTKAECYNLTMGVGNWTFNELCGDRKMMTPHNIRPCCYGVKGQCKMTSHEHCAFLEGMYYNDDGGPDHCSQVNCLSDLCRGGGLASDPVFPYIPSKPNQWWRIFLPLIYNHGIVQIVITVIAQLIVGRQIERTAGPVRIAFIYITSGIMGLYVGGTMSPYYPQAGAGGAIFGMIGVLVVELAQSWHLVQKPWIEVAKLLLVFAFFLLSGTLPFVNNFTLLGGFVFGVLVSIAVLPYVTFGKWHIVRKRLLIGIVTPFIVILIILAFIMFYVVQSVVEICGGFCEYLNCVPYTNLMCNINDLW